MPSYDDFTRDYWAPDREAVLAAMRTGAGPTAGPLPGIPGGGYVPGPGPAAGTMAPAIEPPDPALTLPGLPGGGYVPGPGPAGGGYLPAPREAAGGPAAVLGTRDPGIVPPTGPRAALEAVYRQYGLDPGDPMSGAAGGALKNPLANLDYFLKRFGETGGDLGYWKDRLAKEIQLAQQGLGNRSEGPTGAPGPFVGSDLAPSHVPSLSGDLSVPSPGLPGGGGAPGAAGGGDDLQQLVRDRLATILRNAGKPIDEQALGIRQPYQAAQLAAQREQDRERTQLAERLYAQGSLGGNELTQGIQQSAERNAIGLAQLKSGLIANEIAAKRQKVQQGLQLANAIGARQEANALARELASLENQFRYAQLGQQGRQFGQDLGFRYADLAQRGSQFGQELGFRQGMWGDQYGLQRQSMVDAQNRAALLAAMGY